MKQDRRNLHAVYRGKRTVKAQTELLRLGMYGEQFQKITITRAVIIACCKRCGTILIFPLHPLFDFILFFFADDSAQGFLLPLSFLTTAANDDENRVSRNHLNVRVPSPGQASAHLMHPMHSSV